MVVITSNRAGMRSASAFTRFFFQAGQGEATSTAASALLSRLDEKRKDRWSEVGNSIVFTFSSRLAWNTISNLTGRTRDQHRSGPISAHLIASQLVQSGVYKTKKGKSARLVIQEVSETPLDEFISGDFSLEKFKFACALQLQKFAKAAGPDSIYP